METKCKNVFETRFGYVATDYVTYRKLKRLQYLLLLHKKAEAKHDRWARKEPQNRMYRRWVRNPQGQKIHCIRGESIPEPGRGCVDLKGYKGYIPIGDFIVEDYKRAKYPKASPGLVLPLLLSQDEINFYLDPAEEWFSQKV